MISKGVYFVKFLSTFFKIKINGICVNLTLMTADLQVMTYRRRSLRGSSNTFQVLTDLPTDDLVHM